MTISMRRASTVLISLLIVGAFWTFGSFQQFAEAQYSSSGEKKSWTDSIFSGVKKGWEKIGGAPKKKPPISGTATEDDPIALNGNSKPSEKLYVAVAHLYEEAGNPADAAKQYHAALKLKPDYLPALLGYARLLEQQGRIDEALKLYQYAIKTNPRQAASSYNNMALCHARQGQIDQAIAVLTEAVKADPKNPLFRNNIATLLIDRNRLREAFQNLRSVHSAAVAYYNMGYLLYKKGETAAALQHFSTALRADPNMSQARQWIEHLQKETALARRTERTEPETNQRAVNTQTTRRPTSAGVPSGASRTAPPMPPESLSPRRLPPTDRSASGQEEAPMPGGYSRGSNPPVAPLPPTSDKPDIRPLPRVR